VVADIDPEATLSPRLRTTLNDPHWLALNGPKLAKLLPETWTHIANLNPLQLDFNLKLLGVDWRTDQEFAETMMSLEQHTILLRSGMLVRRNHRLMGAQNADD